MAFDITAAQNEINAVENAENPPANVNQLVKAVAAGLGLDTTTSILYHIHKGNLTVKTKARPKPAKADSNKVAVVEVKDNKVVSCKTFADRESAINAAAGMVGHVREALESEAGVFSEGTYSLNVVDLG
jgi:hypothetical protein